ncbi:ROK family protein [Streptomyces sp. NBC_01102]|uniref:ROK family protein n=1 Tax=unclassified Streptomyces TaxID=2593676 RepID=UPI003863FF92|nr:ROK family protein [Streptomyces sp. NBC_01102]
MTNLSDEMTVMDVGGTTLRAGTYGAGRLSRVRRMRVDGMAAHPGASVATLQRHVIEQIVREAGRQGDGRPAPGAALGIAFAGPVGRDGTVLGAPTVWGEGGEAVPLQEILSARLSVPVVVVNDLTAAAWRYGTQESAPFCLLTISSGIGNKVFRDGDVLLDAEGHGGELGHWRCDLSPDAPLCDCGGRGHLGAIASGRGVLAAVRRAAGADPAAFAGSAPARLGTTDPEILTNPEIAAAVRGGDPFVTSVLRSTLVHLASAVGAVFTSIGVRRYILMGGFALAVGERYRELLVEELVRQGCFGLTAEAVDAMVVLGAEDDDHGLVGMGRLVTRRLGEGVHTKRMIVR